MEPIESKKFSRLGFHASLSHSLLPRGEWDRGGSLGGERDCRPFWWLDSDPKQRSSRQARNLLFDLSARQILKERRWSFVTNTDDHQADSCYERDGTQHRRDRHRIGLLM